MSGNTGGSGGGGCQQWTWRAPNALKLEFYSWDLGAIEGGGSPVFQMMKFKLHLIKLSCFI